MSVTAIIPARFASTRFPGKPLTMIKGRSMVSRVADRVLEILPPEKVMIATDDERIFEHAQTGGYQVIMTSEFHQSGTERCAEAALLAGCDEKEIILNVQGDEPYIRPEQIKELLTCFEREETQIATLCRKVETEEDLRNPNLVKVVRNHREEALLFSRSVIPFHRSAPEGAWLRDYRYLAHIGLYAYRNLVLQQICSLDKAEIENLESLEQLRWLFNGYTIRVKESAYQSWAVDTPEDLESLPAE